VLLVAEIFTSFDVVRRRGCGQKLKVLPLRVVAKTLVFASPFQIRYSWNHSPLLLRDFRRRPPGLRAGRAAGNRHTAFLIHTAVP
jgi:hypothetical protein